MLSTFGRSRRLTTRRRRLAAALLVIVTAPALNSLAPTEPAWAAPTDVTFPEPPAPKRVKLTRKAPERPAEVRKPYAKFDPSRQAALPSAQQATVALPASRSWTRAGASPVSLSRAATGAVPERVQVRTVDQNKARAAGVRGVLFALQSPAGAGAVDLTVDDATFQNAFGGDYADRLRLVQLPGCALTTPELPKCQTQTPLVTPVGQPLTARVSLAAAGDATVLAATSAADGRAGDYGATSLSPGGSWSVSGNTGSFTYGYPISVPPPLAGFGPTVEVSYSSSAQDARTVATNGQSSWLGDGWSSTENYIERTYRSCSDVKDSGAPEGSADRCWAGQILTMSLNGGSTAIVYDDDTKTFRPANDNAKIKIENVTGATNGTKNGEYFRVTENGVQYYFGLNRLPGWAVNAEETKSAWNVPVYKAHGGVSACPDGSFAATACVLGYRFNLDYAVDLNGNAMAYYYAPETGHYGANMKNTAVAYTRGGTLKRIDYGMTSSTIYSATAPEQIEFMTAERCLVGVPAGNTCSDSQFTVSHPEYWPDVPIDLNCAEGSTTCTNHGPSFWSRKRLTAITTKVQVAGATKPVDRYDFTHTFPDGGDHAPTLWLDSIKHTGLDRLGGAGADASMPPVTFYPTQLPNRVGTVPGLPRMYHNRITNVVSETGAETIVDYATPDCTGVPAGDLNDEKDTKAQAYASTNATGCFPVYWTPEAQPRPLMDWFYTHPVTRVTTIDKNNHYQDGTQPRLVTEYAYRGKPGWHYDDNELVKAEHRTWGQFRGYPQVDVTTGDPNVFHYTNGAKVNDQKTLTKSYYFLGMDGDTLPDGKKRDVPALTSQDGTVTVADHDAFAGQVFETETYLAGSPNKSTINVPTLIGPTASRARAGLPALTAQMVRPAKALTREKVAYGVRKTEHLTFYNTALGQSTTGMPVQVADRGETAAEGNVPSCTFLRYLDGTPATLVVTAETVVTTQDCSAAGAAPSGTLVSDVRISYDSNKFAYNGDGQSNPARPTRGNATLAQEVSAASGATPTAFVDTAATTYDSYGRVASTTRTPNSKAADGTTSIARTTYTRYAPASGALPEKFTTVTQVTAGANCATVTESSKDCQVGTATMSPGRQLAIAGTDVAGALTSQTYDALGRLTAVWLPNKSKAAGAPANLLYTYLLSATAPSVVTARKLLDSDQAGGSPAYSTSKTLYDAMLRTLETQETSHNGTVTVSDVQYDSHGRKVLTNNSYAAAGTPSDTLVSDRLSLVSVPDTTVTDHDALGRITQVTAQHKGVEKWRTRTAYTGDKVTVLPPQGDVATTTTTDAHGRTTKLEHYTARPTMTGDLRSGFTATGGTSNRILYTYTASGLQSTVTGPDDSVWRFSYDIRGRRTSLVDPDIGTNLTGYDDAGNVLTTKDARGIQLDFTYDLLGRKLAATDRSKSNFKYASWAYDTLRIGNPTSSTRFVSGVTGGYKVEVTGYSVLGNPLGQTLSLPTVEKPLPTEYTTTFAYTPNTEMLAQQQDPTVAGLGGETITYGYNSLGAPIRTSGTELYVSGALYTDFGQLSRVTMGASTNEAQAIYSYDEQTLRLAGRTVYRAQGPGPQIDETKYTYDEAGNPLSVTNVQSETGNTITDRQCYQYDALARLAEAWTAKDACAAAPAASEVSGGAGAYWQSFTYNAIGDRTRVVDHSSSGGADVVTGYENGCLTGCNRTGKQPHTLTATTGGGDPTKFVYDAAGNLLTRTPTTAAGQTLKWDDEGNLAEVTTAGATPTTTKYLYDADGNQLIRRDPGRTTLFAGDTEVVIDTSVTPARELGAVRSYSLGGGGPQAAVRSSLPGGGTHYMFHDPHGTGTLAMDTTTQQVSRQQTKPYGEPRSTSNPTIWPDATRGFLGAPKSTHTGYTDVGARKYDPGLGRFISADPLMIMDSGQLGGYTYSGDNPMGFSDPSGLGRVDGDRPGCAPGNGGTCGGYVTEDDYFDEPSGPEKPGRGRSNEKADRGCFGTCDGRMVLYKNIVLPAELGAEKQQRIATRFYKSYRDLFCYRNGYCEEADQLLPLQFMIMLKGVCHAEGGCGKDIDEMVTFPKLLGQAVQDNAFGGGEGSMAGGAGMPITTSAVGGKGTTAPPSAVTPACRNSFTPDTLVLMADGSTKPIKDVKLGDKVLATDPETGETAAKPVTVLHDNLDHDFVNLTVIDEDGDRAIIRTTYHHPFWNEAAREWVDAGRLSAGTALRSVGAQEAWAVQAHVFSGSRQMLNLTVADIRTYYVLAGDTPVLVHNTPPTCPKNGGKLSSPLPKGMSDEIADAYDAVKRGELVSHDTYVGREHPAWGGAAEYAIPGRPDNERILVKTYPSGVKKIGWTSTHYRKIQQFEAPHFPDSGWIPPNR